jgi:hypothetical protein
MVSGFEACVWKFDLKRTTQAEVGTAEGVSHTRLALLNDQIFTASSRSATIGSQCFGGDELEVKKLLYYRCLGD